jgi:dTDP-4-dehydrorhamnose 3,5-epimerase
VNLLSDILISETTTIPNELGNIIKIIQAGQEQKNQVSEVYCSWLRSNRTKAWKKQEIQTMNLFVIIGTIRFVFIDCNEKVMKIDINAGSKLLTIPPGIWYGFKCISDADSLILNITDLLHNPDQVSRLPLDYFPESHFND